MSRTVFLTGATGFIGSRLARALHDDGWELRCLVREATRAAPAAAALAGLGAELVTGDVTDSAALARGLDGAALAYHLAAIYDIGVVDAASLERVNVEGTRAFLNAVEQAGTPRCVYVSTTAALGPAGEHRFGDESSTYDGPFPTVYHRTKTIAHALARAAQQRGVPVVIVAPANVYGPGDTGPNGRFIADLLAGRVPGLLLRPSWLSYVHVDDVVAGLVAAGERGSTEGVYVLSGEHESVNRFAQRVTALAGRRAPRLRFPAPIARIGGAALDVVARATGRRFALSRESVNIGARDRWLHGHERATREFGWTPRPLDVGLPATVAAAVAASARP